MWMPFGRDRRQSSQLNQEAIMALDSIHRVGPLLLVCLCCFGCKVGPNYVEPVVPVDPAFINAPPQTDAAPMNAPAEQADARRSLIEWWTVFGDPMLIDLVMEAIAHNQTLQIAEANLRQARELLIEARFRLYPIVPARAEYRHGRLSEFAAGPGQPRNFDVFSGGFDATWEVDIFGGVSRAIEARTATVGAFDATRDDVLISVVAEVARNYFELRGNQTLLDVAKQNAANQQITYDLTLTLLQGGRGTEFDTSRSKSQLESTLAIIPPLETIIEQAIYRLGVLTGRQPAALIAELLPPAPLPVPTRPLAIGTPAELIRRRPDVRVAERTLAASTAFIGVNTADLYPRITIDGSIGLETGDSGSGFTGGADAFSIGPRLTWAAFDIGRVRARIRASEAQTDADLANFELTVLNALEEVDSALLEYGNELRRKEHLVAAEEASRKAEELARQRFQDGVTDFLDVLDAQRTTLATQEQLAESATRSATLLVAVYKALGGGWEVAGP
jgi:multidrug efflux system outer membrane protein